MARGRISIVEQMVWTNVPQPVSRVAIMHPANGAGAGTLAELKASIGSGATLTGVFMHDAGTLLESGGGYHETTTLSCYPGCSACT